MTTTAPRYRSAILNSLATQQPHPMFRKGATVTQQTQPQRSIHNGATFAQADAAVAALAPGRYALPRTTPDGSGNMINFFKVFETRNRQGVKGNRIVMLIARGGGDYSEVRLSVGHQIAAAKHIAEDVTAARQLYGRRTGTCGDCGRALSNEESLAYGIGPVCRNK